MAGLINPLPNLSRTRSTKFSVSLRSLPYLADHGFQDMIVLPGSFYFETALKLHRDLFGEAPGALRNISFQNPVILSDAETVIQADALISADGRTELVFRGPETDEEASGERCFARMESEPAAAPFSSDWSAEEFQLQAASLTNSNEFYRKLRENGNQYGPQFQKLVDVGRSGDRAFGRLAVRQDAVLHPTLVDAMTQLLAVFMMEEGRTFVLKSIDRFDIHDTSLPETLWARATRRANADMADGFVGDIEVFDESGKHYFSLTGVSFTYLDRVESAAQQLDLCVASTFTAEPLEDSLKFWGDHFGAPVRVQFAPYNQIFQQLLDTESAFGRNGDGANIILLGLEDWTEAKKPAQLKVDREKLEKCFNGHARHVLPNGLEVVHLNRYETDYVYKEIFQDQCYLRHGIRLNDGDTVIDIGANIGLFSLFVMNRCQNARIYAFEPSPVVYELLKANCETYGNSVSAFNCGVADRSKTAEFTFYEKSSVFSGFHSDDGEDREAIEAVVRNVLNREIAAGAEFVNSSVDELTNERLSRQTYQCRLTSVSDIIRENEIGRIHLLKIDAEKSELDVINGIEDCHWPLIDQIVIEVHDRTRAAVDLIERTLLEKGYRCAVEQERLLENSGLFNIYATRLETAATHSNGARHIDGTLERNINDFCAALNSFMTHSATPMLLCVCPRSPDAGKLNEALDQAEQELLGRTATIRHVHFVDSGSVLNRHALRDYYDAHSAQLGHVPYTPEGYAAIGTTLFQTLIGLKSPPIKVIVLDCDNTLWKGVCGEDGSFGIELTEAHRFLQKFVLAQMKAGVLLCLCSKNNEADVFDVFERRKDMLLKREHVVSWRLNWKQKSDNIKALADELELGLDSFLLLDDNPVECAEVRSNCPEVLTLQLPQKSEAIPAFLKGIWGLGHTLPTGEDLKRTKMYQENLEREQFREQTVSLKDFLNGLQLRVDIDPPTEDQVTRISQLTFRTNQFNFTTIRRSEGDIRNWLGKPNHECLIASVSDRFGDYGMVGVILYETSADHVVVDTFLLSCRVLGRGVEHQLLQELGRRANAAARRFVELRYLSTDKNEPALDFIHTLGANLQKDDTGAVCVRLDSEALAELQYEPDRKRQSGMRKQSTSLTSSTRQSKWLGDSNRSEVFQRIGEDLFDIDRIAQAIEDYRYRDAPADNAPENETANTVEKAVADIWKKVLGRRQIGLDENFFEGGGTSLRAVQVIALIQKELKRSLSITSLFECPTIRLLAAKLNGAADTAGRAVTAAQSRGQQRRHIKVKRKTALT